MEMKMKAALYKEYGSPDVFTIAEVPKPSIKPDQVLIKIKATTVNRTDTGISSGRYWIMRLLTGISKPRRPILGTDFSGVVSEIGSKVTKYKVGDSVIGFNDEGMQSQAEYLALAEKDTFPMPANISYEQAAASLEGVHYAINFMNKADISAGKKALVYGASGSIGSALLQLLRYNGVHVTAVCGTENIAAIQELNPDRLLDYKKEDYWKEDVIYDYVFDAVGKSSFSKSKPVMAKKGIYISSELGDNAENIYLSLYTPLLGGKRVKFPLPQNIAKSIETITPILEEGFYKPLIDKVYPFEEIIDAYKYVVKGYKVGNVVVKF